jgi:hypothetical protein
MPLPTGTGSWSPVLLLTSSVLAGGCGPARCPAGTVQVGAYCRSQHVGQNSADQQAGPAAGKPTAMTSSGGLTAAGAGAGMGASGNVAAAPSNAGSAAMGAGGANAGFAADGGGGVGGDLPQRASGTGGAGMAVGLVWPDGVAIAHLLDSCSRVDQVACDGHNSTGRLRCDGAKWVSGERCNDNSRCSTSLNYLPGSCLRVVSPCIGKSPGDKTCINGGPVTCDADLLSILATGVTRCSGATPFCDDGVCTCRADCGHMP